MLPLRLASLSSKGWRRQKQANGLISAFQWNCLFKPVGCNPKRMFKEALSSDYRNNLTLSTKESPCCKQVWGNRYSQGKGVLFVSIRHCGPIETESLLRDKNTCRLELASQTQRRKEFCNTQYSLPSNKRSPSNLVWTTRCADNKMVAHAISTDLALATVASNSSASPPSRPPNLCRLRMRQTLLRLWSRLAAS